jgi:uncharacterized protein (TIGR02996 family)
MCHIADVVHVFVVNVGGIRRRARPECRRSFRLESTALRRATLGTLKTKGLRAMPPSEEAPQGFTPSPDEQGFLDAIKKAPDDLTAHEAYADWLAEHERDSHAAVVCAWVALVRVQVTDGISGVAEAYRAYRKSLYERDREWIELLDSVRLWTSKAVAEKIVRVFIGEVFGSVPAETWSVNISPRTPDETWQEGIIDGQWQGTYHGDFEKDGQVTRRIGEFNVHGIIGSGFGYVDGRKRVL